jgi:adenylate kinase family enzyme
MKRVTVVGPPGSGKSTIAGQIAHVIGCAPVYLDALFWQPGWVRTPREQFLARHAETIVAERWVIDGVYRAGMNDRLAAADTIVFLDLPRRICIWRVIKRRVLYRGQTRPDMAPGCPEQLDRAFILYVWRWWQDNRPELVEQLDALAGGQTLVRLTSRAEVAAFLASVTPSSKS